MVKFLFQRRYGYFLINFYGPCSLIVILSWVAFWINREATADRIGLGLRYFALTTTYFECFFIWDRALHISRSNGPALSCQSKNWSEFQLFLQLVITNDGFVSFDVWWMTVKYNPNTNPMVSLCTARIPTIHMNLNPNPMVSLCIARILTIHLNQWAIRLSAQPAKMTRVDF